MVTLERLKYRFILFTYVFTRVLQQHKPLTPALCTSPPRTNSHSCNHWPDSLGKLWFSIPSRLVNHFQMVWHFKCTKLSWRVWANSLEPPCLYGPNTNHCNITIQLPHYTTQCISGYHLSNSFRMLLHTTLTCWVVRCVFSIVNALRLCKSCWLSVVCM